MLLPELTERILLSDGRGYIPCSSEYLAARNARDAIFRPTLAQPSVDHLRGDARKQWFELNGVMDRLQWQGGHLGATIWFDPPGDVPHGWAILQKQDKRDGAGITLKRDGQWHLDFYVTATGDNGENDRGLLYALDRVSSSRKGFKEWADRRQKPRDTEYLLVQCFPVDEAALAASANYRETADS